MKNEPTHANLQVCLQIFGLRNKQLELIKTSEKLKIMLEESMEYIDFKFIKKTTERVGLESTGIWTDYAQNPSRSLPSNCDQHWLADRASHKTRVALAHLLQRDIGQKTGSKTRPPLISLWLSEVRVCGSGNPDTLVPPVVFTTVCRAAINI